MNKEINYVLQGVVLLFVVAIFLWAGKVALNIRPSEPEHKVAVSGTSSSNTATKTITNQKGRQLFKENCSRCHRVDKDMTGPALANVEQRVADKELLYHWIKNNQAVLKSGNPYFNRLYQKYNKTAMDIFPQLTDEDIANILAYVKEAS